MSGASAPLVPPDFSGRALPIVEVAAGEPMFRSCAIALSPIFFGTRTKSYRFDDPMQDYGVLYAGRSEEAAFAETFLRTPGRTMLTLADLAARGIAQITSDRPLRLARLHSQYLAQIGATAEVEHGPAREYSLPQAWSRAVYQHPEHPDGIEYRSRHDDSQYCLALFDRCESALRIVASRAWTDDMRRLGEILDRYRVALS